MFLRCAVLPSKPKSIMFKNGTDSKFNQVNVKSDISFRAHDSEHFKCVLFYAAAAVVVALALYLFFVCSKGEK